jgi:hypothetical protein
VVERQLPKLDVAGSTPVSRSKFPFWPESNMYKGHLSLDFCLRVTFFAAKGRR